jgi:hypothetical protein
MLACCSSHVASTKCPTLWEVLSGNLVIDTKDAGRREPLSGAIPNKPDGDIAFLEFVILLTSESILTTMQYSEHSLSIPLCGSYRYR